MPQDELVTADAQRFSESETISSSQDAAQETGLAKGREDKSAKARRAAGKAATATLPQPQSPVDKLYMEFVNAFGNSNPAQVFSMVWPGTILDWESYAGMTATGPGSAIAIAMQSMLFDQHYPVATITQPDGTRVSDRYSQAIDRYGPVPNAALSQLQAVIRDRLAQTTQMMIDGQMVTMTLLDQFDYLNGQWLAKSQAWAELQASMLAQLEGSGDPDWWDKYVAWYAIVGAAQIAAINSAYDRLIVEFPMNAFQTAIAILDTQEAAALNRAKNDMRNATVPVPPQIGNEYVTTQAIPQDWGAILVPSTTFLDLLASPDAQQAALNQAIGLLQQQVFAWTAVLAQIPAGTQDDIAAALAAFNTASAAYSTTISNLLKTYSQNALTAVQVYLEYKEGTEGDQATDATALLTQLNDQGKSTDPNPKTTSISAEDFKKIADQLQQGQSELIEGNSSMIAAGFNLAQKATIYLNSKAGEGLREIITPVVNQLSAQLTIVQQQAANFQSAAVRTIQLAGAAAPHAANVPVPDPTMPSLADSLVNQRWMEVTMSVSASDMATSSNTSTSFSQMNWSVDLFFGSAGGQSESASNLFATHYMDSNSSIEIGMLATKVLIQRPWMHPELFNLSSNYYRASDVPVTTPESGSFTWTRGQLVPTALGGSVTPDAAAAAAAAINQGPFPAYPVALLLVKDVTIKIKYLATETDAMSSYAEQNSTQGGGFLCFSISETQSSSSTSKSAGSYSMGGSYVFRIAAPQIAGVWLQIAPPDQSQVLTVEEAQQIADALGFVTKLNAAASAGRMSTAPPVRPVSADA